MPMLMSATIKSSLNQHEVEMQIGGAAKQIHSRAKSTGYRSPHTDEVTEIHNTLRKGLNITLTK